MFSVSFSSSLSLCPPSRADRDEWESSSLRRGLDSSLFRLLLVRPLSLSPPRALLTRAREKHSRQRCFVGIDVGDLVPQVLLGFRWRGSDVGTSRSHVSFALALAPLSLFQSLPECFLPFVRDQSRREVALDHRFNDRSNANHSNRQPRSFRFSPPLPPFQNETLITTKRLVDMNHLGSECRSHRRRVPVLASPVESLETLPIVHSPDRSPLGLDRLCP